jgi:cellulose biosynthesis protein BcsQ
MSTAAVEAPVSRTGRIEYATPVLAVIHPKGGVGRSTTVWHLAAELALRGRRVRIEDLDQGAHLSRVFNAHPLGLDNLRLAGNAPADLVILDTAPEADQARALEYLRRSDWLLVPVKGPEEDSVPGVADAHGLDPPGGDRALDWLPADHAQTAARLVEVLAWPT